MQPSDSRARELVAQWVAQAEEDSALASELLEENRGFWSAICFHAQQAAEKYLKAYLVYRQVEFPKTHDIERLLDLVETVDVKLAESLRETAPLGAYAVAARYPDMLRLTVDQARSAVEMATKARAAVRSALPPDHLGPAA